MSHTLNLVIVDDDPDDHQFMKEAFWRSQIPVNVLSLYNGQQLLDFFELLCAGETNEEGLPDLILLDINMPVKSGFDTLEEISRSVRYQVCGIGRVPVYLLSTCRELDVPVNVLRMAKAFFHKPYNEIGYTLLVDSVFSRFMNGHHKPA